MELVSVARGGPRDGVKLMCPHTWDGRVARPVVGRSTPIYYRGHYAWDRDFSVWIWHADKPAVVAKKATAETPHHR